MPIKNRLNTKFRMCDDLFWSEPYPYETPPVSWETAGYTAMDTAPDEFYPNFKKLVTKKGLKSLRDISRITQHCDGSQLRLLALLITMEESLRKYGFHMGQVVYWRTVGDHIPNYLDQWVKCYVLSESTEVEDTLCLATDLKRNPPGILIETSYTYVQNRKEFKKTKTKLIKTKKLVTPNKDRRKGLLLVDNIPTDKEILEGWFPELADFEAEEIEKAVEQQNKDTVESDIEVFVDE